MRGNRVVACSVVGLSSAARLARSEFYARVAERTQGEGAAAAQRYGTFTSPPEPRAPGESDGAQRAHAASRSESSPPRAERCSHARLRTHMNSTVAFDYHSLQFCFRSCCIDALVSELVQ